MKICSLKITEKLKYSVWVNRGCPYFLWFGHTSTSSQLHGLCNKELCIEIYILIGDTLLDYWFLLLETQQASWVVLKREVVLHVNVIAQLDHLCHWYLCYCGDHVFQTRYERHGSNVFKPKVSPSSTTEQGSTTCPVFPKSLRGRNSNHPSRRAEIIFNPKLFKFMSDAIILNLKSGSQEKSNALLSV